MKLKVDKKKLFKYEITTMEIAFSFLEINIEILYFEQCLHKNGGRGKHHNF